MSIRCNQTEHTQVVEPSIDALMRYEACKSMARGYADAWKVETIRLDHARAFCSAIIQSFWLAQCEQHNAKLKIKPLFLELPEISADVKRIADVVVN